MSPLSKRSVLLCSGVRLEAVCALVTACALPVLGAAQNCDLPAGATAELLHQLDTFVAGHPKKGHFTIEYINRGNIVLFHLPAARTRAGRDEFEASALIRYYPLNPIRWGGGSLWNNAVKHMDFMDEVNVGVQSPNTSAQSSMSSNAAGPPYVAVVIPPKQQQALDRLHRMYPDCPMRPLPPEPRLLEPIQRSEICRIERDWSEVTPAPVVPPSPDSPLKRQMIAAIIRDVARETYADPGRNRIVIRDFNINDQGTAAALLSAAGGKLALLEIRLDKNDPCLAEARETGASYERGITVAQHVGPHPIQIYP